MSDDLERRLQGLRPAEMPPELMDRIGQAEPTACGRIFCARWWAPLAAAAAAIAVLMLPLLWSGGKTERRAVQGKGQFEHSKALAADSSASDIRLFVPIAQSSTLFSLCCLTVVDSERSEDDGAMRQAYRLGANYLGSDARIALRLDLPIAPARFDYGLPLPEGSLGSRVGFP